MVNRLNGKSLKKPYVFFGINHEFTMDLIINFGILFILDHFSNFDP